ISIEHRQSAGVSEADRTDVGVRRGAEGGGAGTENLRLRQKTRVHLQADDSFPLGHGVDYRHRGLLALSVIIPRLGIWAPFESGGEPPHSENALAVVRHFCNCTADSRNRVDCRY